MPTDYGKELERIFDEYTVLDLPAIRRSIPGRSRASLFRDLRGIGYLSSFNKAGRYFTLTSTCEFDEYGIWQYDGIYFSRQGTLKNTVRHLVETSVAGYTQSELQQILKTRVHNTLLDLVSAEAISRASVGGNYVYTNRDPSIGLEQMEQRRDRQGSAKDKSPHDPYLTIEVLRAAIKYPGMSAKDVGRALSKEGVKTHAKQIEGIFDFYGLGKKNSR